MMYLHAWQSRLWNEAASARVRLYGADGAVEGDLVLLGSPEGGPPPGEPGDGDKERAAAAVDGARACRGGEEEEGEGEDEDGLDELYGGSAPAPKRPRRDAPVAPAATDGRAAAGGGGAGGGGGAAGGAARLGAAARLARVHVVTAQEAAEGRFGIGDVVLPLPGSQVRGGSAGPGRGDRSPPAPQSRTAGPEAGRTPAAAASAPPRFAR
jgi:hypothetical protein